VPWKDKQVPLAPVLGGGILLMAELVLLTSAREARDLGIQMFLIVLVVMAYYRLGQVETRMIRVPDLRLGIGKYHGRDTLPKLPSYVLCTASLTPAVMVTEISHLLKTYGENIEIILFHAEEQQADAQAVSEGLERFISQQLEAFYEDRNLILSMKVLPGNLVEVLPEYVKKRPIERIFMSTGPDVAASEALREHLANETGLEVVRLNVQDLPKGPGVWFSQWSQDRRFSHRD
jgi:hypothetical protein